MLLIITEKGRGGRFPTNLSKCNSLFVRAPMDRASQHKIMLQGLDFVCPVPWLAVNPVNLIKRSSNIACISLQHQDTSSYFARSLRNVWTITLFTVCLLNSYGACIVSWRQSTGLRFIRFVWIVNLAYGPYVEVIGSAHLRITTRYMVLLRARCKDRKKPSSLLTVRMLNSLEACTSVYQGTGFCFARPLTCCTNQ